jgi:hypothetical protein
VASFTDDGTTLNWVTPLTSPNGLRDEVHGLALDPTGTTLYAVGSFGTSSTVGTDGFVEQLDAATGAEGSVYSFADGTLNGVAVDATGNVFVAGWGTPTSGTATQGTLVAKFDATLDHPPVYSTLFTFGAGGSVNSAAKSIAVDPAGHAYVGGTYQVTATDTNGAYLRVNMDGSSLDWSFHIGNVTPGPNGSVNGVAYSGGFLYLTGTYHNDGTRGPRALSTDLLIAKADAATGSTADPGWIFRYAGVPGPETDSDWGAFAIQVNSAGNAYVAGHYFDQTGISPGGTDARAWKFAANGGSIVADIILAGSENDDAYAIALGTAPDDVFFAGITASDDFPTTDGVYQETYGGGVSNAFIARLSLAP